MLHTVHDQVWSDNVLIALNIDVNTWNYKQQHLNHYVHRKLHKRKLHHNPNSNNSLNKYQVIITLINN